MIKAQEMKRIAKFALLGVGGFVIGLVIVFIIAIFIEGAYTGTEAVVALQETIAIFYAILGASGAAALGLASRRGWRKVTILALVGAIGFAAVSWAREEYWFMPYLTWEKWSFLISIVSSVILGVIIGTALGLTLGGSRKIIGLALAGALGFVIGALFLVIFGIYYEHVAWFAGPGIVGFTFLGAALGFLEKGKAETV